MGWDGMEMGPAMGMKPLPLPHARTLQRRVPVMCFMSLPEIRKTPFFPFFFPFFHASHKASLPLQDPTVFMNNNAPPVSGAGPGETGSGYIWVQGSFSWGSLEILICFGMVGQ